MIFQIPYELIGKILSFAAAVFASIQAQGKVRNFFSTAVVVLFVVPFFISLPFSPILMLVGQILTGIVALIYLRFKAHGG